MRGDGVFQRKDRKGYYLSWIDAEGKRHKRKAKGFLLKFRLSSLSANFR